MTISTLSFSSGSKICCNFTPCAVWPTFTSFLLSHHHQKEQTVKSINPSRRFPSSTIKRTWMLSYPVWSISRGYRTTTSIPSMRPLNKIHYQRIMDVNKCMHPSVQLGKGHSQLKVVTKLALQILQATRYPRSCIHIAL